MNVAGLIGFVEVKGSDNLTDLNLAMGVNNKAVVYRFIKSEGVNNGPINGGSSRFYLLVLNIGDSYIYQHYIDLRQNKIYCRFYLSSSWSDWKELV